MNYFVYKFLDKDGNALYVGQTIDMDRRMSEHKGKIWDQEKDHIEFARCENMADMCIYEMYYINKLHAKYNDCLVYNVEPSFELPELNFEVYDTKLIDKMHQDVMKKARLQFSQDFDPRTYWPNKKANLEEEIKLYKEDSIEYNKALEEIKRCDENIKELGI